MVLQVIKDNKGKDAGVFIPMQYWKKLKKKYTQLAHLETDEEPTKSQLLKELKEAVLELKLIQEGKLTARSAKEFLNEL